MTPTITEEQLATHLASKEPKGDRPIVSDLRLLGDLPANLTGRIYTFGLKGPLGGRPFDGTLVLRVTDMPGFDYEIEASRMRKAAECGIPVPRVYDAGTDHGGFGGTFMILEYVPGMTVAQYLLSRGVGNHDAGAVIRRCNELMLEVHGCAHLDDNPDAPTPFEDHRTKLLSSLHAYVEAVDEQFRRQVEGTESWLSERIRDLAPAPTTLIHGDFQVNNLMVDDSGAITVLDWTNARREDPRTDLAWCYLANLTTTEPAIATAFLDDALELVDYRRSDIETLVAYWGIETLYVFLVAFANPGKFPGLRLERAFRDYRYDRLRDFIRALSGTVDFPAPEILARAAEQSSP